MWEVPHTCLFLSHRVDIPADQIRRPLYTDGAVHAQLILVGVAPLVAGDALVIGPPGGIGPGNAPLPFRLGVAVHLHHLFDAVLLRRMDKHPDHVVPVPQHIVRRTAHDDTGTFVRNHVDGPVLGHDGLLDGAGTQVQLPHHRVFIRVDAGYERTGQPALLGGQGGHLLIVAGHAQLFRHQLADPFAGGSVLPGDGDDDAGAGGTQNGSGLGCSVLRFKLPPQPDHHHGGDGDGQHIGHGRAPEDAGDAPKPGHEDGEQDEQHVPEDGQGYRRPGVANRLQEDGAHLLHTGEQDEGEVDAQAAHRELSVQHRVHALRAEHSDEHCRDRLKEHGADETDDAGPFEDEPQQLPHTAEFFRAVVIAYDGLGPGGDADGDVQHDLEQLHDDHEGCQGDVLSIGGQGPVSHQQDVVHDGDDHDRQLGEEAGRAQSHHLLEQCEVGPEAGGGYPEGLAAGEIGGADAKADELPQDGSPGRALNAQVQHEDGHRVANDVQHRPGQHGPHGVLWAAVRPDDGGQGILHQGQGHHGIDDEAVVMGQGQVGAGGTDEPQQAVPPQVADEDDGHAAQEGAQYGVAHDAVDIPGLVPPQGHA